MSTSRRSQSSTTDVVTLHSPLASAVAGPSNAHNGQRAHNPTDVGEDNDAEDEDGGDADEQEVETGWTENSFKDVPISKSTENAVRSLDDIVDHLKDAIRKIEDGFELAKEAAMAIEEARPDDQGINTIEAMLFKAFDQRHILQIKKETLEKLIRRLKTGEEIEAINEVYLNDAAKKEREYLAKSNRLKYKKLEEYSDFRSGIWEINHDTACPPVSHWLEKGDEDDDSDIDMGGQTQTYRCPLTLQHYKQATTWQEHSVKCNHSFSYAAIVDHIEKGGCPPVKCPVTGCSAKIDMADLKDDPGLQKRADAFESRKRRRDEDEDEDDAIDVDDSDNE